MALALVSSNSEQVSAFLALLKSKGESVEEIVGIVNFLQNKCETLQFPKAV